MTKPSQVIGQYPDPQDIPESGINYTALSNGETLRLGKATDPANTSSKVFAFQLAPNDPSTSGSKRSEIEFPANVENGKTYWIAFSVNVEDWGSLPNGDAALFGTQVHSGDSSKGYSPSFALVTYGGATGGHSDPLRQWTSTRPTRCAGMCRANKPYRHKEKGVRPLFHLEFDLGFTRPPDVLPFHVIDVTRAVRPIFTRFPFTTKAGAVEVPFLC